MTTEIPLEVLILPGLGGSGPAHWQTRWEAVHGYERLEQTSWDAPSCDAWLSALDARVKRAPRPMIFAAHSLACVLVARWARTTGGRGCAAALLVAPADVEDPAHTPPETHDFAPIPRSPLPFPSLVIASTNDPFMTIQRARALAGAWRAGFVDLGPCGHINAESGLGDWPAGHAWLETLLVGAGLRGAAPRA